MEQELYSVENYESDYKTLSELSGIMVRIRELVSDITAIDETIEVSKYALKYNHRPPYTEHDLGLMKSVENQVLSWLVDVIDKPYPITVYDDYVEALDRTESMLRNE